MTRALRSLFLVEQIVLAFTILSALLYWGYAQEPRDPLGLYQQRLTHSVIFYFVGLLLTPFALRLRAISRRHRQAGRIPLKSTLAEFRARYLSPAPLLRDLRIVHAISVMFVVYMNLKNLVPVISPTMRDPFAFRSEVSLFGSLVGIKLQQVFGLDAAPLLASGYVAFYSFVAVLIFLVVLNRRDALALEFAAAFVLLWFIGILLVYVLPTLGPCFFQPQLFSALPFTDVTELQQRLWEHKTHLETHAHSSALYLISGFPSLHLAVPLLGAYYLRHIHPLLAVVALLFAALTAVTTLYFGWHYLMDDIGSVLLAIIALGAAKTLGHKMPSKDSR